MDPKHWQSAWHTAARCFGATSGILFFEHPGSVQCIARAGFTDDCALQYEAHFHTVDLWLHRAARGSVGRVWPAQQFVPASEYEASEIWWDFARPRFGAFHAMGAALPVGGRSTVIMGLHRQRQMPEFDTRDAARMDLVLPHLRNALVIADQLAEADAAARAGAAALDALSAGAVIVDGEGRIVFANRAAEAWLATGPLRTTRTPAAAVGLSRRISLTGSSRPHTDALLRLIAASAGGGPGGAMILTEEAATIRLQLRVMPLPTALAGVARRDDPAAPGLVLVIIRDLRSPNALPSEMLIALYGLTDAETAVAQALLGGATAEQVAAARHVALATVRAQIRGILDKTGARNLRDLERFIAAA